VRRISEKLWTCVRQRAGPLTKEVRYRRPQLRLSDLPSVRREKNEIVRGIRDCCFRRTPTDRLELMLGLMGWGSSLYTLTFADEALPETFAQCRAWWRSSSKALNRLHGGAFRYVYAIEGLHGDRRWHVHLALMDEDFDENDVLRCWGGGVVRDVQPMLSEVHRNFWDRAYYLTKERRDGDRIPRSVKTWVAAPMLYRSLPPPEKKLVRSGAIRTPKEVWDVQNDAKSNAFGSFNYRSWIRLQ